MIMKSRRRWVAFNLCLALLAGTAATEEDLDVLLADYQRFGLPLPPPEAELKRLMSGVHLLSGEKFFRLGFVLPPAKEGGQPRRFSIFGNSEVQADYVEAAEPVAASFTGTVTSESFDLAESFYQDHTLAFAIQCQARGWRELAQAAYKPYSRNLAVLRRILRFWARDAAVDRLRDPSVDQRTVLQQLKAIAEAARPPGDQRRDPLIDDLEKTLATPPSDNEAERWVSQLMDITYVRRDRDETENEDNTAWRYHPVYASMLERWFERMPLLLEHIEDRRITRCARQACASGREPFGEGSMLHPGAPPARVGDLVRRLITDVAAQEFRDRRTESGFDVAAARAWWAQTQPIGEEAYLQRNVFRTDEYRDRSLNAPALFLLAGRYPKRFQELYRKLIQEELDGDVDDIAIALHNASLEADVKTALWIEGTKAHSFRIRSLALQSLFKAQHPEAVQRFLEELKRHPATPPGEYWTCQPPYLLGILRWTEEDAVWRAFLRFTENSDIGQRAQIINHAGYTYLGQRALGKRLAFLAHFLEDRAVCDPCSGPKYNGVPAAHFLGKVTLRNLTASTLGGLLAQKPHPAKNWTLEQWEAYITKLNQDERLQRAGVMAP